MDPATRDYILSTIITNYNPEAAVIISTHLISDVEKVLDDVIFINQGQVVLQSSVDQIREEKGHERGRAVPGGVQMLRKLLKHEFRATARIMVPVYLVLLVTALGANFSTRGILKTPYAVLNILGSLLVMAFVVAIMAVCVVSFLLMIQRFYKNLLRDEGYLMLTLPASVHQQVWSS